jgi:murein L,D-transpeptidase YafK
MKSGLLSCGLLGVFLALGAIAPASAQTVDDVNWINKCVADNKDEGQTQAIVTAYCTCMNNEMSNSETKSITAWEKTHKAENEACSKKAGWK